MKVSQEIAGEIQWKPKKKKVFNRQYNRVPFQKNKTALPTIVQEYSMDITIGKTRCFKQTILSF